MKLLTALAVTLLLAASVHADADADARAALALAASSAPAPTAPQPCLCGGNSGDARCTCAEGECHCLAKVVAPPAVPAPYAWQASKYPHQVDLMRAGNQVGAWDSEHGSYRAVANGRWGESSATVTMEAQSVVERRQQILMPRYVNSGCVNGSCGSP